MKKPLYVRLARTVQAMENCRNPRFGSSPNTAEWLAKHTARALKLAHDALPSGSGIDAGCALDVERSTSEKLVFHTSFHHMDENGFYGGWTEHTVTVRASLTSAIDIRISGRNRNDVKDYLHDVFMEALCAEAEEHSELDAHAEQRD